MDEVDFVQNVVYYVERAYRIPDYGMWERGSRDNVGRRELHARYVLQNWLVHGGPYFCIQLHWYGKGCPGGDERAESVWQSGFISIHHPC